MRFASTAMIVLLLAVSTAPVFNAGLGDAGLDSAPDGWKAPVTFTNVTRAAGLAGSGGTFFTWADYDNDGDVDLLIDGWNLMRNELLPSGTATFTQGPSLGGGGVWADLDNDGDLDTMGSRLWRNNGDGTFTDITSVALSGYSSDWVTAAGWGDFDRDGFVDLYIARGEDWNNGNPRYFTDDLWRNDGDGTFTNVSAAAGIWAVESASPKYGRGVAWCDYNNDGWPDIYVSNYRLQPNYLWENQADGTFREVALEKNATGGGMVFGGVTYYGHTIGAAWGDLDNDGYFDLVSANLAHKDDQAPPWNRGYFCDNSKLYRNGGGWTCNLTDIRAAAKIPTRPVGGTAQAQDGQYYYKDELWAGSVFGDCDNDGDLDLFIPGIYDFPWGNSFLYLNNGNLTFTDGTAAAGTMVYDTYGGAWADFNNDGRLDLVTGGKSFPGGSGELHLFQNDGPAGNFVKVNLKGTEGNRAGIGARLTAYMGGKKVVREVEGGTSSHTQQNTLVQHLGLGSASKIDVLEVKWVSGRIQFVRDIPANTTVNITEGTTPIPTLGALTHSPPKAEEDTLLTFTAAVTPGAGGTVVRCFWDFSGDGLFDFNSSTLTAQHACNRSGAYRVVVRVLDSFGYAVERAMGVNVSNVPPVANAGEDRAADMDSDITLDGSGSSDTPTDLALGLLYKWEFGDGAFRNWSSQPTANHTYSLPGVYNAELSVRDDDGAEGTARAAITVRNLPPDATVMEDQTAMEDEVVQFAGTANDTASDRKTLSYKWDFGDGNRTGLGATASASHAYRQKGNYTATFSVRDAHGAVSNATVNITVLNPAPTCRILPEFLDRTLKEDATAAFDGEGGDNPSDLGSLLYRWDFGDGNITDWSPATPAAHAYTRQGLFNVTLTVRDDDGDTGTASATARVQNVAPSVEILSPDQTVQEDRELELTGAGSDTASDQEGLEYQWNFGDGERSGWLGPAEAVHTYPAAGRYKVSLAVRDDEGLSATSEPIYIDVENVAPHASAAASSRNIDEDGMVRFTASGSSDTPSDLGSLIYSWDFGDRSDGEEGMNVSHAYAKSGTYTVKLRVTDDNGAVSEDSSLRIKVSNLAPKAAASASAVTAKAGEAIKFAGRGNDTPSDLPQLKFSWSFGDGQGAEGSSVSHAYAAAGRYTVRLLVADPEGASGESVLSVEVTQAGKASSPPAGPNLPLIGGAAAGALVAAVAVLWLARRRK